MSSCLHFKNFRTLIAIGVETVEVGSNDLEVCLLLTKIGGKLLDVAWALKMNAYQKRNTHRVLMPTAFNLSGKSGRGMEIEFSKPTEGSNRENEKRNGLNLLNILLEQKVGKCVLLSLMNSIFDDPIILDIIKVKGDRYAFISELGRAATKQRDGNQSRAALNTLWKSRRQEAKELYIAELWYASITKPLKNQKLIGIQYIKEFLCPICTKSSANVPARRW